MSLATNHARRSTRRASITKASCAALMSLLVAVACDVETDTSSSHAGTADERSLLAAKEDARLAMQSLVECDSVSSEDCASEEEALLEALQEVDDVQGEHEFRATCYASCSHGMGVSCGGSYSCEAWDGWGCASYVLLNGVPVPVYNYCPPPPDCPPWYIECPVDPL